MTLNSRIQVMYTNRTGTGLVIIAIYTKVVRGYVGTMPQVSSARGSTAICEDLSTSTAERTSLLPSEREREPRRYG